MKPPRAERILGQCNAVVTQIQRPACHCRGQFRFRIESSDALAAAAGIGLDDDGIAQSFGGSHSLMRRVNDPQGRNLRPRDFSSEACPAWRFHSGMPWRR